MTTASPILGFLDDSNIQYAMQHVGVAGTWRWPGATVPVWIRRPSLQYAHEAQLVRQAIQEINRRLTGRIELQETPRIGLTSCIAVSFGTAYRPEELRAETDCRKLWGYRANVSNAIGACDRVIPDEHGHPECLVTWLNIGIGQDNPCKVDLDIVLHEFGHALGLTEHFEGFGLQSGAISEDFWDVLATLYNDRPLTPLAAIRPAKAAP